MRRRDRAGALKLQSNYMTEIETIQFEFVSRVKAVQARQEARARQAHATQLLTSKGIVAFPISKAQFFSALPPGDPRQQQAWNRWCRNLAAGLAFEIAHEAHLAARQAKKRFKKLGSQGREANALIKQWCEEVAVQPQKDRPSFGGMMDLVHRLTKPGHLVCDPFMGGAGAKGNCSMKELFDQMAKEKIVPKAVITNRAQQLPPRCFLTCFLIGRRFIGCGLDADMAQAVCA